MVAWVREVVMTVVKSGQNLDNVLNMEPAGLANGVVG